MKSIRVIESQIMLLWTTQLNVFCLQGGCFPYRDQFLMFEIPFSCYARSHNFVLKIVLHFDQEERNLLWDVY